MEAPIANDNFELLDVPGVAKLLNVGTASIYNLMRPTAPKPQLPRVKLNARTCRFVKSGRDRVGSTAQRVK